MSTAAGHVEAATVAVSAGSTVQQRTEAPTASVPNDLMQQQQAALTALQMQLQGTQHQVIELLHQKQLQQQLYSLHNPARGGSASSILLTSAPPAPPAVALTSSPTPEDQATEEPPEMSHTMQMAKAEASRAEELLPTPVAGVAPISGKQPGIVSRPDVQRGVVAVRSLPGAGIAPVPVAPTAPRHTANEADASTSMPTATQEVGMSGYSKPSPTQEAAEDNELMPLLHANETPRFFNALGPIPAFKEKVSGSEALAPHPVKEPVPSVEQSSSATQPKSKQKGPGVDRKARTAAEPERSIVSSAAADSLENQWQTHHPSEAPPPDKARNKATVGTSADGRDAAPVCVKRGEVPRSAPGSSAAGTIESEADLQIRRSRECFHDIANLKSVLATLIEDLKAIAQGKKYCRRYHTYHHGTSGEKKKLEDLTLGPFVKQEQIDAFSEIMRKYFKSEDHRFIHQVLLPEAHVMTVLKIQKCNRPEADQVMQRNYLTSADKKELSRSALQRR